MSNILFEEMPCILFIATLKEHNIQPRLSIRQRLKGLRLKKIFLLCMGIGTGLAIVTVGTVQSVGWLMSRPIRARDWPLLEGPGLKANLRTDWNGSVRYQLRVAPRSNDLKAAFDETVKSHRDSIFFTVHLYDQAGFELCRKVVKPTPQVDAGNHISGLETNDRFKTFECSRSNYKDAHHWNLSYVFPKLTADTPKNNAPVQRERNAKPTSVANPILAIPKENTPTDQKESKPTEEDDTLTGFDFMSGHLETLSGNTFLVRTGEQGVAHMWNINVQVEGRAQPRLHITCKTDTDCVIENTENTQSVHGKRIG